MSLHPDRERERFDALAEERAMRDARRDRIADYTPTPAVGSHPEMVRLAHAVAGRLPRGARVTARASGDEYELWLWVSCDLPRLRFWRRARVREEATDAARAVSWELTSPNVLVHVQWGEPG